MTSAPTRFLILKEAGVLSSEAMVILYTELFLEAISLAVVVAGIALIFRASGKAFVAMIGVVGGYAMFVIALGVLGYIMSRRTVAEEAPGWAHRVRLHGKRWEIVQRWFDRVRTILQRN